MTKVRIESLSIYLLRTPYVKNGSLIQSSQFQSTYTLDIAGEGQCELHVRNNPSKPPPWASFFADHLEVDVLGTNRSVAAVLLVHASDRVFALTFGVAARSILVPDCWETGFGFRVTTNVVDKDRLRSVDTETPDENTKHARVQATRATHPNYFGMNVEQDLLRSVTGEPENPDAFGTTMTGRDHLSIKVPITLDQLPALLERTYTAYRADSYKSKFPWLDNLALETEPETVLLLDAELEAQIATREPDQCWLAVPQVVDWDHVRAFRYGNTQRSMEYAEISWATFFKEVNVDLDIAALKRRHVYSVNQDGVQIGSWQLYKSINMEYREGGKVYILSNGQWYRVAADFVERVDERFHQMDRLPDFLPEYDDEKEADYNARVAKERPDWACLMDAVRIPYANAAAPIEFCDLFTKEGDFIHVKRYSGSSGLSHLFTQGFSSAEAFLYDPDFRRAAQQKIPEPFTLRNPDVNPKAHDYRVVYAIVQATAGDVHLPFLARLSLLNAWRRLDAIGYTVVLTKIEMTEERKLRATKSHGKPKRTF